ncbi:MAG: hypothetical protein ACRCYR_16510 [Phycicoccus sp.]
MGAPEAIVGSVVCDDILELYEDEVAREIGALGPGAMAAVGRGLRAALAL